MGADCSRPSLLVKQGTRIDCVVPRWFAFGKQDIDPRPVIYAYLSALLHGWQRGTYFIFHFWSFGSVQQLFMDSYWDISPCMATHWQLTHCSEQILSVQRIQMWTMFTPKMCETWLLQTEVTPRGRGRKIRLHNIQCVPFVCVCRHCAA